MAIQVGDQVKIKRDALDFLSKKRGYHKQTFEVVAILPNGWARLAIPHKGTSIWPTEMLRKTR